LQHISLAFTCQSANAESGILRTFEEVFGVTPLLNDAAQQSDLKDLFAVLPLIVGGM
jgi:hypothetical protein